METGISSGLLSHTAHMQTLPLFREVLFCCVTQRLVWSGKESVILPTHETNHSAGFGSPCLLIEQSHTPCSTLINFCGFCRWYLIHKNRFQQSLTGNVSLQPEILCCMTGLLLTARYMYRLLFYQESNRS